MTTHDADARDESLPLCQDGPQCEVCEGTVGLDSFDVGDVTIYLCEDCQDVCVDDLERGESADYARDRAAANNPDPYGYDTGR